MESDKFWDKSESNPLEFDRDRHITYLQMMYQLLPEPYQGQRDQQISSAFIILGLDITNSLHCVEKEAVVDWVLSLQYHPKDDVELDNGEFFGFHGSRSSQFQVNNDVVKVPNGSHLASTYCALAILKTVGYDLTLINSNSIMKSMKNLQQPDGSFMPIHTGAETDLRFVYCAAAISCMLEDWSGMDKERAKNYIINCQSYDGGFGLIPGSESHGGATYCAISSLQLMGFIEDDLLTRNPSSCTINVPLLVNWCLQRQEMDGGFQGRPNKPSDTCYAFWIVGVLKILGACKFIDERCLREFLLTCQSEFGGFSKFPRKLPDLYHSYYGLCAFSLLREPNLKPFSVELGMADVAALGI
ncbi:hypothetical protein Leryth_008631 [Lithospermum erythrorhizon]|nr:hypothetical protein Leryth_008631 [Lithospermum erythrorhizon]